MQKRYLIVLCLLILGLMLLGGCGKDKEVPEAAVGGSQVEEVPQYTVTLHICGDELVVKKEEATCLTEEDLTLGRKYEDCLWLNEIGLEEDPFSRSLHGDAEFFGYPRIRKDLPVLPLDANGYLNPDGYLSAADLKNSLCSLVDDIGFRNAFTSIEIAGGDPYTIEDLQEILDDYLPKLPDISQMMEPSEDSYVTRLQYANLMREIFGVGDVVITAIPEYPELARDLDLKSPDLETWLLAYLPCETMKREEWEAIKEEASMMEDSEEQEIDEASEVEEIREIADAEEVDEETLALLKRTQELEEMLLSTPWTEGPHILAGHLYYAGEDGEVYRNRGKGVIFLGEDGRYTTADEELDQIIEELTLSFEAMDPSADRLEVLWNAFVYVRDSIYYTLSQIGTFGENDGTFTNSTALRAFNTGTGNCYEYACAFGVLARNLGYNAHIIAGWALDGPHSFCYFDVDESGTYYIFDPQMAMRQETGVFNFFGETLFMYPLSKKDYIAYYWIEPKKDVDVTGPIGFDPRKLASSTPTTTTTNGTATTATTANGSSTTTNTTPGSSTAPGSTTSNTTTTEVATLTPEEAVALAKTMLSQPVANLTAVIGEPISKQYSSSCMGPGKDGMWQYDGFCIYTYQEGSRETIRFASLSR